MEVYGVNGAVATATDKAMVALIPLAKAVLLILGGIITGKILGSITEKILEILHIREGLRNIGASPFIGGFDIVKLTKLFVEWYTYIYFIMAAFAVVNLPSLAAFVDEIKTLLVASAEAFLVIYIGIYVAKTVKMSIERSTSLPAIPELAYYLILYIAVVLALGFLYPEGAELLNKLLYIIIGSLGLGLALGSGLAIGLGAKGLVERTLNKYFEEK